MAIFGITNRATFIVDKCINGWLKILRAVFYNKSFIADYAIDKTLQNIKTVTASMDTVRERMFDVIDELDIDRFMFDIWGKIPADSPTEKETESKSREAALEKDGTEPEE